MPGEKKMCLKTGVSSSIGGYLSEALEKDAKLGVISLIRMLLPKIHVFNTKIRFVAIHPEDFE